VRDLLIRVKQNPAKSPAERLFQWARMQVFVVVGLMLVLSAVGGYFAAVHFSPGLREKFSESKGRPAPQPLTPISSSPVNRLLTVSPGALQPGNSRQAVYIREGALRTVSNWWYLLFAILLCPLLTVSFVVLTRKPDAVVHDSPQFREALDLWSATIAVRYRTPRELKRFLNFVRYLAMRWRSQTRARTPTERAINWLAAKWKWSWVAEVESKTYADEALIVAMASLAPFDRNRRGDHLSMFKGKEQLDRTFKAHNERFGSVPSQKDWDRFYDIIGEIEINE
jgi:hypothetical protein